MLVSLHLLQTTPHRAGIMRNTQPSGGVLLDDTLRPPRFVRDSGQGVQHTSARRILIWVIGPRLTVPSSHTLAADRGHCQFTGRPC